MSIAVQPQESRQTHGKRCKTHRADQCDEIIENRDGLGEDKRDGTERDRAAHPGNPMNSCVGLQMAGVTQDTHENVFGGNLTR